MILPQVPLATYTASLVAMVTTQTSRYWAFEPPVGFVGLTSDPTYASPSEMSMTIACCHCFVSFLFGAFVFWANGFAEG